MKKINKKKLITLLVVFSIHSILAGCSSSVPLEDSKLDTSWQGDLQQSDSTEQDSSANSDESTDGTIDFDFNQIPAYSSQDVVVINDNKPFFTESDMTAAPYEMYSQLDELGRCGVCEACVGQELMPEGERGEIGYVKPTGWHTVKYPEAIRDNYLYNRCHLIAWSLCGENDNVQNLITGTRQMNLNMCDYEDEVRDYVKSTNNHVMYRVTPYFENENLVATGVLMEAKSVEDDSIEYCVFLYNVQNYIDIDYLTGDSDLSEDGKALLTLEDEKTTTSDTSSYVVNTNTKKFHETYCSSVPTIKPKNRWDVQCSRDELVEQGYEPCKNCNP